ncbi:FAD-dependent oxidoreductase [Modestobacter excelsi]|uniref:FAD-dependent oxidoreductase n=1 Tax=Modestobacter excelsi TaxID=2213161 RepID=UPI00110D23F5|nr:FAD-dependent oxidoreductase [Modestobacter excelsi]
MNDSQHLVVGAGLAGAAIAWRLAERGQDVTLVDRRRPAAEDGSSHGSARIFRYAYPELRWTELVQRALPGWRELERLHGGRLITPTGALDLGDDRDPRRLAAVLAAAGIEHELIPRAEARQRWPQIDVDTDVLHHPGAGVIDAETAVHAMVAAAQQHGAQVLTDWPLARLERAGSGFTAVAADGRTLSAGHVVVSAGGWLPDLLGALPLPSGFLESFPALEVREENAFHFPYAEDVAPGAGWPTLIHKRADIQVYALPGGRDADFRGQKVAEYNGGRKLRSAAEQSGAVDPANRARVVEYVRTFLPGLVPEPYAETTCLFTNTPTEDFVIDGVDGVTVVSPCSGHGAKFAPLLGEIGADVAMGAATAPAEFRVRTGAGA